MSGHRPLILGATGRIGRAFRHLWAAGLWPDTAEPVWQARAPGRIDGGFVWDMIGPPPGDARLDRPGAVICLAGPTSGDLDSTTQAALAACDIARRTGRGPVLIASSVAVYGAAAGPVTEDTPTTPTTPYGAAKLAMERAVRKQRATCLRIGNVAGAGSLFDAAARGPVTLDRLPGGGAPARAWIGPLSLARVLLALARHGGPLPGVLNVASPGTVAMDDILRAAGIRWSWRAAPQGVLADLPVDVARLARIVPLPPATADDLVAEARAAGWRPAA